MIGRSAPLDRNIAIISDPDREGHAMALQPAARHRPIGVYAGPGADAITLGASRQPMPEDETRALVSM